MYVGVLLHVALLVETLAAELAGVGPSVRVYEQVGTECARAFERLAALFALEDLLRRVDRPVLRQADLVAEGFVA